METGISDRLDSIFNVIDRDAHYNKSLYIISGSLLVALQLFMEILALRYIDKIDAELVLPYVNWLNF